MWKLTFIATCVLYLLCPLLMSYADETHTQGMVFISAGEFMMGSDDGENHEKPVHTVYLDDFYIDKYPVTNAEYRKFMQATNHPEPKFWDNTKYNQPNQPVVGISWYDAMTYAKWANKSLPTEAEWEKAARGGLKEMRYPWGNARPDRKTANYTQNFGKPTPVGKYPPNNYGLYDMAGNVWEWCLDEYDFNFYKKSQNAKNPFAFGNIDRVINNFMKVKTSRVLRGGSWYTVDDFVRVAYRMIFSPDSRDSDIGFRCVVCPNKPVNSGD